MKRISFLVFFLSFLSLRTFAQSREVQSLNENWDFHFAYNVLKKVVKTKVNVPHTWNADEVKAGKIDYYRTVGEYSKKILFDDKYKGKRLFLRFEGANSVATILLNQKFVGE